MYTPIEAALWGALYVVLGALFNSTLGIYLFKLNKYEKELRNQQGIPARKEVENLWDPLRIFIALVFFLCGFVWSMVLNDWLHLFTYTVGPLSYNLFRLAICIMAAGGWWRLCYFCARMWLKGYAPMLYSFYQPYRLNWFGDLSTAMESVFFILKCRVEAVCQR